MTSLHVVQGGIKNGDKKFLETAARKKKNAPTWIAPKAVAIGDEVVIYVAGIGFFATAKINSLAVPRDDKHNRYGASLTSIRLIEPAISLTTIQQRIPALTWANYPRSITTPDADVANQIRKLINRRRKTRISDIDDTALEGANLAELRALAIQKSRPFATKIMRMRSYRVRSKAIHLYVLKRANGLCEACSSPAPFCKANGDYYLEPHHTTRLADEGPDHPAKVIALCPNCHRRAHYSQDSTTFNTRLKKKLIILE